MAIAPGAALVRWAVGAVLAMCLSAAALGENPHVCDKDRLLSLAPADVEAVVVVNHGARQRQSAAGRALEAMLQESEALPETRSAWRELARTLNWSEEEAFDHLLGRRLIVVMRGLADPDRTQWAVLSEVSAQTERRLRERLRPVPRGHVGGMLVHSVENGRYELVVGPAVLASEEERRDGAAAAMILLGPGSGNRLMSELAPMLLRPMPMPPAGPGGRECDVVFTMWQARPRSGVIALTGTFEDSGWDLHLLASPGMVWGRPAGVERIVPWSEHEFQAIEGDALLAVMGVIGAARLEGISAMPVIAGMLPVIPFDFQGEAFGQRAAFFVREDQGSSAVLAGGHVRAEAGHVIPGAGMPGAAGEHASRLTVGMAIEAADSRRMREEGDQMIARLMRALESGRLEAHQSPPVQLLVAAPDTSVRVLRLDGGVPVSASVARMVEGAFGEDAMISWGVRSLSGRDGGPGWWVAALSPGGSTTVERDAAALVRARRGGERARLSIGVVRPSALYASVHRLDPGFLMPLRTMRFIDLLRWDAWQRDDGTVEATLRVRVQGEGQ